MNDQLALLTPAVRPAEPLCPPPCPPERPGSWELDDHTRHVGRQGIAAARLALRQGSARAAA